MCFSVYSNSILHCFIRFLEHINYKTFTFFSGSASFAGHSSWLSVVGFCFQRGAGCYVWSAEDLVDSFLQRWSSILLEGRWQHGQLTWITRGTWIPVILSLGPWGNWNICLPFSLLAAGFTFSASHSARMWLSQGKGLDRNIVQNIGPTSQFIFPDPS